MLTLNTVFKTVPISNAQVLVVSVHVNRISCTANYIIQVKKDQILDSVSIEFPYDLNGPNPIKQAYLYLKTLPEFADAVDS
jgi:hypothetical protein